MSIEWVAGFFEGEASFEGKSYMGAQRRPMIEVHQKDREPLEKLQLLVGGTINRRSTRNIYRWRLRCGKARELLEQVYPHMSKRRQAQIAEALSP